MRQPQGYRIITGPGAGAGEADTYTCAHCGSLRAVPAMCPAGDMPDVCHLCGDKHRPSFICERCRGQGCTPFEKVLEQVEAKARFRAELVG